MDDPKEDGMARRAIATEDERWKISHPEEAEESPRYVAISRVRTKIQDELPKDVDTFLENHPGLYSDLVKAVISEEGVEVLEEEDPELLDELRELFCE